MKAARQAKPRGIAAPRHTGDIGSRARPGGQWLHSARWRKARAGYLRKHPLCCICEAAGQLTPATDVDHIVPHHGDYLMFWASENWQGLCHSHHSRKTALENGFGRAAKNHTSDLPGNRLTTQTRFLSKPEGL